MTSLRIAVSVFAVLLCADQAIGGRYSGALSAQSEGDDPSASGLLNVQTTRDSLLYNSTLFNSFNVTGVHLHLSPSRGAVFGGPLILALTNTTTANGQAPVSSINGNLPQNGQRTSADLAANPMLPMVRSTLQNLGVTGNSVQTIGDIANLIEAGLVYSDVHTTVRVSPQGLIRGVISELSCPFPLPREPLPSTSPSPASPAPGGTTSPPAPNGLRNPCYCNPQSGGGSDGYQYCFNFIQATSDVNCNPPAGKSCKIIQADGGWLTQSGGPVYQCS